MNVLNNLENMGFKITWNLIDIGLKGYKDNMELLSHEELFDYLTNCLGRNASQTDNIISLLCEGDDHVSINRLLSSFAAEDKSIESIQCRKWKALILEKILNSEYFDYLQGILEFLEYWTFIGEQDNCPHDLPDRDKIPVQEYFTEVNYNNMIEKNSEWLKKEIQFIVKAESDIQGL